MFVEFFVVVAAAVVLSHQVLQIQGNPFCIGHGNLRILNHFSNYLTTLLVANISPPKGCFEDDFLFQFAGIC